MTGALAWVLAAGAGAVSVPLTAWTLPRAARSAGRLGRTSAVWPVATGVATAGATLAIALRQASAQAVLELSWLALVSLTAACADLRFRRIPNALTLVALAGTALLAVAGAGGHPFWPLAGGTLLFLLGVVLARVGGLGMGDAKWLSVLGLGLGPVGALAVLCGASLVAALAGTARTIVGHGGWHDRYAFAPFLAGALVAAALLAPGIASPPPSVSAGTAASHVGGGRA